MSIKKHRRQYVHVKPKFKKAIRALLQMNKRMQKQMMRSASNKFVKDFSSTVAKLRYRPYLVSQRNRRKLHQHKRKLRILADSRASIKSKRRVLNHQTGGIFPILIPIIAASIGAAGSVAGAAVHAAIARA